MIHLVSRIHLRVLHHLALCRALAAQDVFRFRLHIPPVPIVSSETLAKGGPDSFSIAKRKTTDCGRAEVN